MISAAEIRERGFHLVMHLDYDGGGYLYVYESALDPRVKVRVACGRGAEAQREIVVGRRRFGAAQWDAAAEALASMGEGKTDG